MANSFFKSIKNAFVTEIPDETPSVVEEKNVAQTPQVVQSVVQTPQSMFISTASAPKAIEGQVDDELLQKLCQAMEDSNLPGPDYLELKNVANYLVKEYGFDANRFIIVGNGPEKAIKDGVVGSNQNYRTTDFQLVNE